MSKRMRQLVISATAVISIIGLVVPMSFSGIQFAKADGVTVSGRVVSSTGAPLSEIGGWAQIDPTNGGPGRGEDIENNGTFSVGGITPGQWSLNLSVGGNTTEVGPAPITFNVGSSSVNLGDIRLVAPQVTGTALEPTGNDPITEGSLGIESLDHTVNRWTGPAEDGSFSFGGLRRGTYSLTINPNPESGFTQGTMQVVLETDSSVVSGIQLRATTPNVIGTVVKPDGSSLELDEGQWLNLDLFNQDQTVRKNTNAGEDGGFAFGGVPAGAYTLEIRPQGLPYTAPVPQQVTVGAGVTNLGGIRLTTPKLQGTVTDPEGEPVRDAWIQLHTEDWSTQVGANTNEEGLYQIGGVANGTYKLEVQRPWNRSELIPPDPVNVTITNDLQTRNIQYVAATKFLSGTVRRTAAGTSFWTNSGDVVTNAQVNANKEGGNGWASTNVNGEGEYELALGPGVWNVMVQAPWGPNGQEAVDWVYQGMPKQVTFANNSTVEEKTQHLEVVTADARAIGQLLKPDGTPVTNASVDLRSDNGSGMNGQVSANGRFNIPVVAGSYRLSVWTNDQSLSFPEIGVSVGSGETKNLGVIRATTKDARIIVKAVKDTDGSGIAGLRVNAFRHNGMGWANGTTDPSGISELAVTSGKWGVNIEAGPGARYVRSGGEPNDVEVPESDSVVSYEDNDRLLIEMTYADAEIAGHIVNGDGEVITGFCSYAFARPNEGTLGEDRYQEFGGPVNCQDGSFSIYVPTDVAGTYALGIHTPPNSPYLSEGDQNVAVFSDTTTEADIVVVEPNARVAGRLIDQNGDEVEECRGKDGFGGWVAVDNHDKAQWFGTELRPDCTYSVNLRAGPGYSLNVWAGEGGQFLERPPSNETFRVREGDNTRNFEVMRADKTISGRVTDPRGRGVDAFVFAHTMNDLDGPPSEEDMKNELFTGTKTEPDGTYELGVVSDVWEVGSMLPPDDTENLPSKFQEADMRNQDSATVNLRLQEALGQMRGRLLVNGNELPFGFVACWDDENGTFSGAPADFGEYALNYSAGTYTCQADSFEGETFFRSDEVVMTFTDQTRVEKDFELAASNFKIPPPVVATFSSTESQVLAFENGTTITIPAGALTGTEQTVSVTGTPTISTRKNKDARPFGPGYELVARDANSQEISQFVANVTIKFTYDESQLEEFGIEDEATLSAKFYSDETGWTTPTSVSVDTERNEITIQTNHFTTFAVVGTGTAQATGSGTKTIVVGANAGGGPQVTTWTGAGDRVGGAIAYAPTFRGGVNAVQGDLDGDGTDEIVTAPASAGGAHVRVFDTAGTWKADLFPYTAGFRGGLSLALGNLDDDAGLELIVAPSIGGGPHVRTFDYADGAFSVHSQFFSHPAGLRSGVTVKTGDVNGDGTDDIVVSTNTNAAPHVRSFDGTGGLLGQFMAYPIGFRGGVNVTVADVDGDGSADIVTTPKMAGGPQVGVFRPDGTALARFFAFPSTWRLGLVSGVGDLDANGTTEIVVAPQFGGSHVRIFGPTGTLLSNYYVPYPAAYRGGLELAVGNVDSDANDEIVTAPRLGGGPHVMVRDTATDSTASFMALHPGFRGGVNLALSQ